MYTYSLKLIASKLNVIAYTLKWTDPNLKVIDHLQPYDPFGK